MKKYWKIPVAWSMMGTIEVEARTLKEALEIARDDAGIIPIPENGTFMDGSWEVDCSDDDYIRNWYNDGQEDCVEETQLDTSWLDTAKETIRQFCLREYGADNEPDFTDLTNVSLAYTTLDEAEQVEIQVIADLVNLQLKVFIARVLYAVTTYGNMNSMVDDICGTSFDDLICVDDDKTTDEWLSWAEEKRKEGVEELPEKGGAEEC